MSYFKILIKIISIFGLFVLHIYGRKIARFIPVELNIYEQDNIIKLRKSAAECTLFLNKNDEFPIKKPGKVLLIGSGARLTLKGGLGSGDVESRYFTTCEEGLEKAGFVIISKTWLDQYPIEKEKKISEHMKYMETMSIKNNITQSFRMTFFPEYDYDLSLDFEQRADISFFFGKRGRKKKSLYMYPYF